jgi:hypothetical protein
MHTVAWVFSDSAYSSTPNDPNASLIILRCWFIKFLCNWRKAEKVTDFDRLQSHGVDHYRLAVQSADICLVYCFDSTVQPAANNIVPVSE